MATCLVSIDPTLQVRTARSSKECYGADKSFRSPRCTRRIRKGATYVAKVDLRFIGGAWRWDGDLRKYCEHCALACLTAISVGEEKAA
jgi:hypothetical protein